MKNGNDTNKSRFTSSSQHEKEPDQNKSNHHIITRAQLRRGIRCIIYSFIYIVLSMCPYF